MQTKTVFGTFGMMLKCDDSFKLEKRKTKQMTFAQEYGTQHESINRHEQHYTSCQIHQAEIGRDSRFILNFGQKY